LGVIFFSFFGVGTFLFGAQQEALYKVAVVQFYTHTCSMKTGQPLASFGKAETGKSVGVNLSFGGRGQKNQRNYCYWLMTCVVAKWAKKNKNSN